MVGHQEGNPGCECWSCRWVRNAPKREAQRAQARKRAEARKPPRPPYESHVPKVCAMCGGPLAGLRRSWCSDECVDLWMIATTQTRAFAQLAALHGRRCFECGIGWRPGRPMEARYRMIPDPYGPPHPVRVKLFVDHVRPLWSLEDHERLQLRWWLPFNLQLLCKRCHDAKTAHEAAVRAAVRRGDRLLSIGQMPDPAEQLSIL